LIRKIVRSLSLLLLATVTYSCTFEAEKKILEDKNTIDICIKLGPSIVYDGQIFYIGVVNAGDTKDLVFTIENTGYRGNLELTGNSAVGLACEGFTVTNQPATISLAPGAQTTFSIRFSPTEHTTYECDVLIPNNDAGESDFGFTLLSEN
jgi:hypothetical protein